MTMMSNSFMARLRLSARSGIYDVLLLPFFAWTASSGFLDFLDSRFYSFCHLVLHVFQT